MPEQASPFSTRPRLYPASSAYETRMLDVGDGHRLYIEQSGAKGGIPVVVLHGGPGGGCTASMRRYFDPDKYRAVLFDQRGCGRSTPFASVDHNTTWDLVEDIERIRKELGIERWIVFGGSWGSTLALLYAQKHPAHVHVLVLRGIFTMTRAELDWFYGGAGAQFWPEAWERFAHAVPEAEREDLITAYGARIFGKDEAVAQSFCEGWTAWENTLATIGSTGQGATPAARHARAFARIENHYFSHGGWLETDRQIMRDMPKIAHIPGHIVQGRYDMICPPHVAYALHKAWPGSEIHILSDSGHAMSEPGITLALLDIMNRIAQNPPLGN